ncbi:hypothetical protein FSHL1_009956 [Fusarium sambucinum]
MPSAPKPQHAAPRPQHAAPRPQHAAPRPQHSAPRPQNAAPRPAQAAKAKTSHLIQEDQPAQAAKAKTSHLLEEDQPESEKPMSPNKPHPAYEMPPPPRPNVGRCFWFSTHWNFNFCAC